MRDLHQFSLDAGWRTEMSRGEGRKRRNTCKCTFAKTMVGDGCRYCQPQGYIDKLEEDCREKTSALEKVDAALAKCKATLAEGYQHTALVTLMADLGGILEIEL